MHKIIIQNGTLLQEVIAVDKVDLEQQRRKSPAKLTFSVLKDNALNFQEGNAVRFTSDNDNVFYGFVFSKSRNKDGTIKVVAYDQTRYLKNKETYVLNGRSTSEVINIIASDFNLNVGDIANTGVKFSTVEDNKELFEIIDNSIQETQFLTGNTYVFYDDFGRLTLRNIADMTTNIVIAADTAEDFDYTSSIDANTFNRIKLIYENKDEGTRDIYIAQDSATQNTWGVLQYYEKVENAINVQAKADTLLRLMNKKTRSLSINNMIGDNSIRPGVLIPVTLNLGDIIVNNFMLVESAKHTYSDNQHQMTLNLIGGEFIA